MIESTVSSSDWEEGDVSQLIESIDGVITQLNTFMYQFVNLGDVRQSVGEQIRGYCVIGCLFIGPTSSLCESTNYTDSCNFINRRTTEIQPECEVKDD